MSRCARTRRIRPGPADASWWRRPGTRVSGWNPAALDKMALPPCHLLQQYYVRLNDNAEEPNYLDCQFYMRSSDTILGLPFNIASYALITYIFAHMAGLQPGKLNVVLGDAHIYHNHMENLNILLKRPCLPFPQLQLNFSPDTNIDDIKIEDIQLVNYNCLPAIKFKMAV